MRAIAVAVPVPGLGALTYLVPDGLPLPPPGARVLVPLGKRTITGIVLPDSPGPDPAQGSAKAESERGHSPAEAATGVDAKDVVAVLDGEPFLPRSIVELAAWVAEYYACGVGEAVATAMPPRAWIESERHAAITEAGELRLLTERGTRRDVLEQLAGGRVVSVAALTRKTRGAAAVVGALEADGLVALTTPLKGSADASRTVRVCARGGEMAK